MGGGGAIRSRVKVEGLLSKKGKYPRLNNSDQEKAILYRYQEKKE